MRYILTTLRTVIILFLFLLLHYVLPQHDVVRISETEIKREDFSWYNSIFYAQADSGAESMPNRDVRKIFTQKRRTFLFGFIPRSKEGPYVYRNEDTGWIWPPYFKFDSENLQAEASDMKSTKENPQWVVVTHYGWRNNIVSIFPNAISVRQVDGPDYYPIPWFNIIFFIFVIFGYFLLRAMWRQFRERKIDPVIDDASDAYARVQDGVADRKGRIGRWLDTWRSKPKR